jgi:hypothetical protein
VPTLYGQTVDRAKAGTARKQLWRAGANYVMAWDDYSGNRFWILSDAPGKHRTPIARDVALRLFHSRLTDPLRTGKHIHYSKGWRLPKIKKREPQGFQRIGTFSCPYNFVEHLQAVAAINRMLLARTGPRRPEESETVDSWRLSHPRPMGIEEIRTIYGQLRGTEELFDFRNDPLDDLMSVFGCSRNTGDVNAELDLAFTP